MRPGLLQRLSRHRRVPALLLAWLMLAGSGLCGFVPCVSAAETLAATAPPPCHGAAPAPAEPADSTVFSDSTDSHSSGPTKAALHCERCVAVAATEWRKADDVVSPGSQVTPVVVALPVLPGALPRIPPYTAPPRRDAWQPPGLLPTLKYRVLLI